MRPAMPLGLALSLALSLGACSAPRLSHQDAPAARTESGVQKASMDARLVVVMAPFADPGSNPLGWKGVGPAVSDAVARMLRNDHAVDVRILAKDPGGDREARLAAARALAPDADYLVVGRVTDFLHTAEVGGGTLKRTGLFGSRNEAFVAVELEVIRLEDGLVVRQDLLRSAEDVPKEVTLRDGYDGLSPRSYLFWSTPLGEATSEAVEEVVAVVEELPTASGLRLEIASVKGRREVILDVGRNAGLSTGDRLRLVERDGTTEVRDAVTRQAIGAELISVRGDSAVAYLSGEPAATVSLVGLRLVPAGSLRTANAAER